MLRRGRGRKCRLQFSLPRRYECVNCRIPLLGLRLAATACRASHAYPCSFLLDTRTLVIVGKHVLQLCTPRHSYIYQARGAVPTPSEGSPRMALLYTCSISLSLSLFTPLHSGVQGACQIPRTEKCTPAVRPCGGAETYSPEARKKIWLPGLRKQETKNLQGTVKYQRMNKKHDLGPSGISCYLLLRWVSLFFRQGCGQRLPSLSLSPCRSLAR